MRQPHSFRITFSPLLIFSLIACLIVQVAAAQEEADEDTPADEVTDVIVVTAQKREEVLQEVSDLGAGVHG